ncbi:MULTISPECIES: DEAD/DEAH box helicase [unclassified Thioalkalivibrio]|uniref:DEAD/DEAH box helicase n=1 Tax=unclassified Thioalkalivibrio TaxID=2621013 RepID=UPI001E34582D|nr:MULTISPECIES: DEAD/DEAH box helicase [unclassified Thioalkalivibrio]
MNFDYVKQLLPALKDPRFGGGFFGPRRAWCYPPNQVVGLLDRIEYEFSMMPPRSAFYFSKNAALTKVERAVQSPKPEAIVRYLNTRVFVVRDESLACDVYAVSVESDRWVNADLKRMGWQWDEAGSCWLRWGLNLATVSQELEQAGIRRELQHVHPRALSLQEAAELIDDEYVGIDVGALCSADDELPVAPKIVSEYRRRKVIEIVSTPRRPAHYDQAEFDRLARKATLEDFQIEGARHGAEFTSSLIADDMGLGKTRQSVVAAGATPKDILVVCPANLKENWRREIVDVDEAFRVEVVQRKRDGILTDSRWVIANYEQMDLIKEYVRQNPGRFGKIVLDESHYLKEEESQRYQHTAEVSAIIGNVLAMTGTPILNREREIHALLKVCGHPLGALDRQRFEQEFAGGAPLRERLGEVLAEWMIRRIKADVLKHFPAKHRNVNRFSLGPESQELYDRLYNDDSFENPLPKLNALRRLVERETAKWVVENTLRDLALRPDEKFIVFSEFRETADWVSEALGARGIEGVTVTGDSSMEERTRRMDQFQEDESCRVFSATTAAGGVGFNLVRGNNVTFNLFPWTPGMVDQAEDRAWRMRQTRDVNVTIPIAEGTIAEDLHRCVESKRRTSDQVMGSAQRVREMLSAQAGVDEEEAEASVKQELLEKVAAAGKARVARPAVSLAGV